MIKSVLKASSILFLSSLGFNLSHIVLGTIPNIAPPSSLKRPVSIA